MTWKRLKTTVLLQHPRMTVAEDDIELPNGHLTKYIYHPDAQDAVTIIAIREASILVQQEYSYPPNQSMYQSPGGAIENGESPEIAALRELREESGYTGSVQYIGSYFRDNRRSKAKMHVVLVKDITNCKKEGGDAEEDITSEWMLLSDLRILIADGKIVNSSILASLALYDAYVSKSGQAK